MKRVLSCFLCISMIFALCACGSSSSSTGSTAEATPAPEYVYKSSFKTIESGTRNYYQPLYYTDDGIYVSCEEVVGSKAPEGAVEEYFGQYDITETRLYFISYDGTITKVANYAPVPAAEPQEGQYDYDSYYSLAGLTVKEDGNIYITETLYNTYMDQEGLDADDPDWYDHYHFSPVYYFRELDSTGKELSCSSIVPEGEDYYYSQCVVDSDNNFLVIKQGEGGENKILVVSPDGSSIAEIPSEDSIEYCFNTYDGTCYIISWGDNLSLRRVDTKNKKLGDPVSLPSDAYTLFPGGGDYPMYYTSGTSFYGVNPESGETTKLFSWMDCDIMASDVSYLPIGVADDGTVRTLVSEFDSSDMVYDVFLADVVKTPYDPSVAPTELTLATQYLEYEMQNAVIDFNRHHDDVRIVVKDYSEYNTEDNYSAGTEKMSTEIIAGNVPDIIYLSGMPVSQFASKGILEDLYPYMEADPDIDTSDFITNVLKAAEYDGKLFHTVSYFYLNTVAGSSSLVGDKPGWSYEQFNVALKELQDHDEEATAFDVSTIRSDILTNCINLELDNFANWETGEVNFTNDAFYSLLEFANQFPESFNWEDYSYDTDSAEARIQQGKQLLYRDSISSTDDLQYLESCYNGTDVTFVGYPTTSGTGNMLTIDDGYAMTSSCSNKEAAWEFLRQMFTEKYYKNNYSYSGFSPIRSVFEDTLKDACQVKYEIDENGQYVLDDEGNRIPEERYYAIGTMMYSYYALSQSIADAFATAVEECDRQSSNDDSVANIVKEEAEAYFQGQKSAQDVAKLIQSKVNIYINEQR